MPAKINAKRAFVYIFHFIYKSDTKNCLYLILLLYFNDGRDDKECEPK